MMQSFAIGDLVTYIGARTPGQINAPMSKNHEHLVEGKLYQIIDVLSREANPGRDKIKVMPFDDKNWRPRYNEIYSAMYFEYPNKTEKEMKKMIPHKYIVIPMDPDYKNQYVGFETREEAVEWMTARINNLKGPYRLFAALEDYSRPIVTPQIDPVDLSKSQDDDDEVEHG